MTALQALAYSVGITTVFTLGSIFDPVRQRGPVWWRTLAGCPLCAGFWTGVFFAVWLRLPWDQLVGFGAVAASLSLLFRCIVDRLSVEAEEP